MVRVFPSHSIIIICFMVLIIYNHGLEYSKNCGLKILTCPCQTSGEGSISMKIIQCQTASNQCEPCDRINDTVKCRIYQHYCRKQIMNVESSSDAPSLTNISIHYSSSAPSSENDMINSSSDDPIKSITNIRLVFSTDAPSPTNISVNFSSNTPSLENDSVNFSSDAPSPTNNVNFITNDPSPTSIIANSSSDVEKQTSKILSPCPCKNGGKCQANNSTLCNCPLGFSGQFCQFDDGLSTTQSTTVYSAPDKQVQCPIPSTPANAVLILESETIRPGEYIRYKCLGGYSLYGNVTRYCLQTGKFAGEAPTCEKICRIPEMRYYKLNYVINPNHDKKLQLIDRFGDALITEIEFSCLEDFELRGPRRIRCVDGVWDNNPPECVWTGVSCASPKLLPANLIQEPAAVSSLVAPGSVLSYHCANGTKLVGDSYIVCTYSGTWEPKLPTCLDDSVPVPSLTPAEEVLCSVPVTPRNGDISVTFSSSHLTKFKNLTMVPVKTRITYVCNNFYRLTSMWPATRECLPDGSWSGKEPRCFPQCGITVLDQKFVRIINGSNWDIAHWPWQAGLYELGNGRLFCGGTVVTETWVLTAAHCLIIQDVYGNRMALNQDHFGLFFGVDVPKPDFTNPNVVTKKVLNFVVHPNYDHKSQDSDIGLIKLDSPLIFNERIRSVCLPNYQPSIADIPNSIGMIAGWGSTIPNMKMIAKNLKLIYVRIISNEACKQHLPALNGGLTENMFCAESEVGAGTCHGDSGGSLCVQSSKENHVFQIEGIVSYGLYNVCATPGSHDVFTRVRKYVDWIQLQLNA